MCNSLAKKNYEVYLIVADGKGDETINGISIFDVGANIGGRFLRMTKTVKLIFEKVKKLDVDICHLHDPELIPIGLKLNKLGKKVIFDSHELVTDQILNKDYLPKFLRSIISKIYSYYEKYSLKKFNLIGATPHIREYLKKINNSAIDICNYPIINNKILNNIDPIHKSNKINYICYIGVISKIRGIKELVQALELTNNKVVLNLAGNFSSTEFEIEIKKLSGWKNVNYLGFVELEYFMSIYDHKFGVVPFLKDPNHIYSQPNKMFEYMLYKLPVICSDFDLWKNLMKTYNCGRVFNSDEPGSIAKVIDYLIDNPDESIRMGKNGYQIIIDKFNWKNEEKKLYSFYDKILNAK